MKGAKAHLRVTLSAQAMVPAQMGLPRTASMIVPYTGKCPRKLLFFDVGQWHSVLCRQPEASRAI